MCVGCRCSLFVCLCVWGFMCWLFGCFRVVSVEGCGMVVVWLWYGVCVCVCVLVFGPSEGTYLAVAAYRFTTLASVMVLLSFSVPCVMVRLPGWVR